MTEFQIFSPAHLAALALVAVFSSLAILAARSRYSHQLNILGATLFACFAVKIWSIKLRDGFQLSRDLPLELCDLAFLLSIVCFVKPRPILITLLTYWGLGGTLQAMVTPDVANAFPHQEFLIFFTAHGIIVAAVVYLACANWHKDLAGIQGTKTAYGGLLVYTFVVGGLDNLLGWNYGYLRAKPGGTTVLDWFGPWPTYVGAGLVWALLLFSLVGAILSLASSKKIEESPRT